VSAQTTARHDAASPRTAGEQAGPRQHAEEPGEFRRRLLDGMAAAIDEHGFRESTIADVVRHARTSRRTFYEHFASKQACFIALLQDANAEMVRQIAAAVNPHAPWGTQVRQAIEAWLACAQSRPTLTLSWIREVPSLGDDAWQLQREVLEAFVELIQTLTDTAELRAAGIVPPPRQFSIMLLAGLRELIAITVEDGGDIADITEVAVEATMAMLGPRG
jgi:AcrR family transcriptional regulator